MEGMEEQLRSFLTAELDGGMEPDWHPCRLTFVESSLDNHQMLNWVEGARRIKQIPSPAGPQTTAPRSSSPQICHFNLFVKYLQRS